MNGPSRGPLAGVRVLDFTIFVNGPMTTSMLAENGADVLKVEAPKGETQRVFPHVFEVENRGKRGMTLDLKHPGAIAVVERLVKNWADVVCSNFRPGVMDRLGFGYERVKAWNPKIVYAMSSGLGPRGDLRSIPCFDAVAQAYAGMTHFQGGGPSHKPVLVASAFSDKVAAYAFFSSILCALVARSRTGEGQKVISSQLGATVHFTRFDVQSAISTGKVRDDGCPPWHNSNIQNMQQASDGKWLIVSMLEPHFFERFCQDVIYRPEILQDSRVKAFGWPAVCYKSEDFGKWLYLEIAAIIATRPAEHWVESCRAAEVPCAPCMSHLDMGDAASAVGKHVRENGYLVENQHRHDGKQWVVAPPAEFSGTPNRDFSEGSWHAPLVGEHNIEALTSCAGFSLDEARALVQNGVCPVAVQGNSKARL